MRTATEYPPRTHCLRGLGNNLQVISQRREDLEQVAAQQMKIYTSCDGSTIHLCAAGSDIKQQPQQDPGVSKGTAPRD